MDLHRKQTKYAFQPPRYSPWLMPLIHWLAERFILRSKFKVADVRISGVETVVERVRKGHAVLVAPNHADHADPSIMLHVGRRARLAFHFMAAREGFERGALARFVLPRAGAFSVDRERADLSAIKTAIQILQSGRYPLVIFPEGEIYHHHESLDDLSEGAATILLRAAAKLTSDRKAYLVPCGIRIRWDDSVRSSFEGRLSRLEQRVTWKPRTGMDLAERIYRLGSGLLALKEEEFLGRARTGTLEERIATLQEELIRSVEAQQGATSAESGLGIPERVRGLRGRIRRILLDETTPVAPMDREQLLDRLDTLFLASQLYSYSGRYLKERPSVNRLAETLFKLEEDLMGEGQYVGPRRVRVAFDEPIDVNQFLRDRGLDGKTGIGPLTKYLEERLRRQLEDQERAD